MKKYLYLIFIFLTFAFVSCKGNIKVNIVDENNTIITSYKIDKGSDFDLEKVEVKEGFYYTFDKTNEDLKNLTSNVTIIATLHEALKDVTYVIDGNVVHHEVLKYTELVDESVISIPTYATNHEWKEKLEIKDNVYYYTYTLSYESYPVTLFFIYRNALLATVEVKSGSKVVIPDTLKAQTGYYYDFDENTIDLNCVTSDCDIYLKKVEYQTKSCFYIDGKLVKEFNALYTANVERPVLPKYMINTNWKSEETFNNKECLRIYTLEYDIKMSKITYMDNDLTLDLEPSVYKYGDEFLFPTPLKEGYEFIGWFVSPKSATRYVKSSDCSFDDITLYARFIKTSDFTKKQLPGSLRFEKINRIVEGVKLYFQPQLPSNAPSSSVLDYTWATDDIGVAVVTKFSSIAAQKPGFTVLSATLNSDPSVVISCFIHVTIDGIEVASQEEANAFEQCVVTFVDKDDNVLLKQRIFKGDAVIPPTPTTYQGLMFSGWDHELWGITENITIKATYKKGNNPYVGKKVAIIGDSISTASCMIPDGFAAFYPCATADFFDYNQSWWMQTVNNLGASLFRNNSYSGSTVVQTSSHIGEYASSKVKRLAYTNIGNESPDIIIIYMGSNDCTQGIDIVQFTDAYNTMIMNLQTLCPYAEIIPLTLPTSSFYGDRIRETYSQAIISISNKYNLNYIDMASVNLDNNGKVDTAHPNKLGMTMIADALTEKLLHLYNKEEE